MVSLRKFTILFFIILTQVLGIFAVSNCSTREFQKLDSEKDSESFMDNLTPEEKKSRDSALSLVNAGNREFQNKNYKKSLEISKQSIDVFPTMDGYYLEGMSYSKLGKNKQAGESLNLAHEVDPKNEQVLISLGLVNAILGEDEEAIANYTELTNINPKERVYQFRKGVQLKTMKRYDESLKVFQSIEPEGFAYLTELYSQLGDVHMKLKNYDEAEKYLALAEGSSPDSQSLKLKTSSIKTASFLEKGNRAMATGDYDRAISSYKQAVANDSKNASPLVFLSQAYILKKDYTNAESSLKKAYDLNDELVSMYEVYGLLFYQKKEYSESISWLNKGIKYHPKSAVLLNRRGLSLWKQGNNKQAKLDFRKAGDADAKFLDADSNLAYLLLEEGRYLEAKRIFLSLEKRSDNKEKFKKAAVYAEQLEYLERGDKYLGESKIQAALVQFDKAKSINPDEPSVWNAYGRAYFIGKKYSKSEANYQMAIGFDPENLESLMGLARLYAVTNQKSKETQTVQKIEALTKDNPTTQILMGRLKEDKGDFVGAEKEYLKVRKNFPKEEAIGVRLGSLYYKWAVEKNSEEKYDEALSYLGKAKNENPNITEIKDTERVIKENREFSKLLPVIRETNRYYDRKKFPEAAKLYQSAFDKSGKPNLLVKVAECYVGMGDEEKALSLLQRADANNKSGSTDFKEAIYSFFLQRGEVDRAERGFLSVILQNPGSYYSYYKLGLIEMDRTKYDRAIEYIDRSLMLKYDFAAGNLAKGIAYYKKGDRKSAEEEFLRAQEKDEEMDLAVYNMGILYFNQNMDKEAKKIFQDLVKKYPDSAEGYYQLSFMNFKAGNIKSAESFILKALKIERSPSNLYAYSKILESKKDSNKWKEVSREITLKYPNSSYAKKLKSIAFKDEPIYFQPIVSKGNLISNPLRVGNSIVQNFGDSILSTDIATSDVNWRIFPKEQYSYLSVGNYLYGINSQKIKTWDLENGDLIQEAINPIKDISKVYLFEWVDNEAQNSHFLLIAINANKEVVKTRLNHKMEMIDSTLLFSINDTKVNILGIAKEGENFLFIQDKGYQIENNFKDWGIKGLAVDSYIHNNQNGVVNSGSQQFLLQSGKRYYNWKPGSVPTEIDFLRNSHSVSFHEKGFIQWKKSAKGYESILLNEKGEEVLRSSTNKDWNLQTLILSK
ncbi:MAG: tetratricopeptide repeat protein [Leptospira sp.]|nr:tetratricopeptide repeat protein [Leptospira sp.]